MLPNRFTEPDFPRQALDVKWKKTTEEGENRKERILEIRKKENLERIHFQEDGEIKRIFNRSIILMKFSKSETVNEIDMPQ